MSSVALGVQADPTTLLDVFAVVSPLLGALIAVGGVVATIIFTNRRESNRQGHEQQLARDRQEHERLLKEAELEEGRMTTLRAERLRAYSTLARLTKSAKVEDEDPVPALAEAHSEIEMLTDDPKLKTSSDVLLQTWIDVWQTTRRASDRGAHDPFAEPDFKIKWDLMDAHRNNFIRLAKQELGAGSSQPRGGAQGAPELAEGSTPSGALPGPEATP